MRESVSTCAIRSGTGPSGVIALPDKQIARCIGVLGPTARSKSRPNHAAGTTK